MKEIRAYIKPHKLSQVTLALHHVEGLTGVTVSEVKGFGRGHAHEDPHSIRDELIDYIPHVKIEIICHEQLVDEIIDTIRREAHTGLRGDGKSYVFSHVEEAVRISTGERGLSAV